VGKGGHLWFDSKILDPACASLPDYRRKKVCATGAEVVRNGQCRGNQGAELELDVQVMQAGTNPHLSVRFGSVCREFVLVKQKAILIEAAQPRRTRPTHILGINARNCEVPCNAKGSEEIWIFQFV
jgi:hypothetical protein